MEKSAKKHEKTKAETSSLEQLVLDRKEGKYGLIAPIAWWAKELRKQEEHRHLTQTDIIELAMNDVLSGKVSSKELLKRMQEAGPAESAAAQELAPKRKSDKKERKDSE